MSQMIKIAILLTLLILIMYMIWDESQYRDDPPEIPVFIGKNRKKMQLLNIKPEKCWPFGRACGLLADKTGKEYIFLGGGVGESDMILSYVPEKSGGHKIIPIAKFSKYINTVSTACVVFDLYNAGEYDDIIVARTDGIYALINRKFADFTEMMIWKCPRNITVTSITIGDVTKKGNIYVYVSCSAIGRMKSPNFLFILGNNGKFTDITDKYINIRCEEYNSVNSVFADLSGDGYPDLIVVNSSGNSVKYSAGCIFIFRNNAGTSFTKQIIDCYGSWAGISIGDYDNSGYLSALITSNSHQSKILDKLFRKRSSKHILLKNNGDYDFSVIESGEENDYVVFPANCGFGGSGIIADTSLSGGMDMVIAGCNSDNIFHRIFPPIRPGCIVWAGSGSEDDIPEFEAKKMYRNKEFGCDILFGNITGSGHNNVICINKSAEPKVFENEKTSADYINVIIPRTIYYVNCIIELKFKDKTTQFRQFVVGPGTTGSNIIQFGTGKKTPLILTIKVARGNKTTEYIMDKLKTGTTYRADQFIRL